MPLHEQPYPSAAMDEIAALKRELAHARKAGVGSIGATVAREHQAVFSAAEFVVEESLRECGPRNLRLALKVLAAALEEARAAIRAHAHVVKCAPGSAYGKGRTVGG